MKKKAPLTPPDMIRCQVEFHTGSFMSLGKPKPVRCGHKAKWVATEQKPGADGRRGSMSVCHGCKKVYLSDFQKKNPLTFKRITDE